MLVCACFFICFARKRLLKKQFESNLTLANLKRVVGHIFTLMDTDSSGTLNEHEMSVVITRISPVVKSPENVLVEAQLLTAKYGSRKLSSDLSHEIYELDRKGFLDAISDLGIFDTSNARALVWICQVEQDQLKSSFKTIIINTLVFHADFKGSFIFFS